LNLWETAINKTTATLNKLNSGDQHLSVYQALRDVVMFSVWCMENQKEAASTFKEWTDHKPARVNTNPYQQPVNLIFERAGVTLESITCIRPSAYGLGNNLMKLRPSDRAGIHRSEPC